MATLETRRATIEDAAVITKLALELGYDCDIPAMRHRLGLVADVADQAVFVAALDGAEVVGWVHVATRVSLTSPAFVEVFGLIVSSAYRRLGIGRALMERCESWAESIRVHDIRVRSQSHRQDANDFYLARGYTAIKEQRVYQRRVEASDTTATPTLSD